MSFVLEAQRRREEQADPDRAARAAYEQAATRRRHRLILIIAGSAVVCAAFASWLALRPAGTPEPVAATAEPTRPTPAETAPPDIRPALSVKPRPAPAPPPPPPERQPQVLALNSASADAQQTLLGFRYSSHIFGSDPGSRYIVVDDQRLQAGDTHGGWTLEVISEDGVIWRKARERVSVPVLQMWESG